MKNVIKDFFYDEQPTSPIRGLAIHNKMEMSLREIVKKGKNERKK